MYVYLATGIGGFNDILSIVGTALDYCIKYNRTLLLDGTNSLYKLNYKDCFQFRNEKIICDSNIIHEICKTSKSIYPSVLNGKIMPFIKNMNTDYTINLVNGDKIPFAVNNNTEYKIRRHPENIYSYNDTILNLPSEPRPETVIVCVRHWGGFGYPLFKQIEFCSEIKELCKLRYAQIEKPYLAIQVRDTDRGKCDYAKLYETNKEMIHSYRAVYIATDNPKVLYFFMTKDLDVVNFATFPDNMMPIHFCKSIDGKTKMVDLAIDIFMVAMSDKLLSVSEGGYIHLIRQCFDNKKNIQQQFLH